MAASEYITVYNPYDTPIVIDNEGHTVGGHDWGTAPAKAYPVQTAIETGRLIDVNPPDGNGQVAEAARKAARQTKYFNERHGSLKGLETATLTEAARTHVENLSQSPQVAEAIREGKDVTHDDLVSALVYSSVAIDELHPGVASPKEEPKAEERQPAKKGA